MYRLKKKDLIFTFLFVGVSGINFFMIRPLWNIYLIVLLIYIIIISLKIKYKFLVYYTAFISIIFIGQIIKFKYLPVITYGGEYTKIFLAFFIVWVLGKNLSIYYVKVIYFFSIVSLIFYFSIILFPNFENYFVTEICPFFEIPNLEEQPPHIIIYKFINPSEVNFVHSRNSGPFWEAGAFAGFLVLAIVFNCIQKNSLFKNKEGIVFILALLTTMSTAGYIAFFVFAISWIYYREKSIMKLFFLPLALIVAFLIYNRLEFLDTKVESQIANIDKEDYSSQKRSRFVSALVDLDDIVKNPILGKGKHEVTRFEGYYKDEILTHRNNSFTGYAQKFGIIAWFVYFYFALLSFKKMIKYYNKPAYLAYIAFFVLCIISFSQDFLYKPFFYIFLFLHLIYFNSYGTTNKYYNSNVQQKADTFNSSGTDLKSI